MTVMPLADQPVADFAKIFLDISISANNDGHEMSIWKKDFGGERSSKS